MVVGFGMWCVAASVQNFHQFILYGGLCLLCIAGLPLGYILINMKLGRITDVHVALREQRTMPFVVATIGAIILAVAYWLTGAPKELSALAISLIVSGILFGIITQFWKVSIHAAAYTGAVIMVVFLVKPLFLWLLIFLPLIIWARLVRKKHSPAEAIAASILNAVCSGGEGGIRTLGTVSRTHAFQACSIDHSDTSPNE